MPNIRFLQGYEKNLPIEITDGQVYFAVDENKKLGKIYFDKESSRYQMSSPISNISFGICDTASNISLKNITLLNSENQDFNNGQIIFILFENTNYSICPFFKFYCSDAETPFLEEEFPVFYRNSQILTEDKEKAGYSGTVLQYVYQNSKISYIGGFEYSELEHLASLSKQDFKVDSTTILANNLIGISQKGTLVSASKNPFLIGTPLYISKENLEANTFGGQIPLYDKFNDLLLLNESEELSGNSYSPLYLKGTILKTQFFPSNINPFTSQILDDDYYYLYIGIFSSTTTDNGNNSYINYNTNHPIYNSKGVFIGNSNTSVEKLEHSITIGKYFFDGTQDVVVPTYGGEIN